MTSTISVPLGPNSSLDGGPFVAFDVDLLGTDTDPIEGLLVGHDDEGNRREYDIEKVGDYLRDEMESNEPVSISTGDVHDVRRDDPNEMVVGTVEIPLVAGFYVEIYDLDGQGKDLVANLDNLRGDRLRRKSFEKQLKRHGGSIRPIN